MRKVNFNTLDNLTVPPELIKKTLAIPKEAKPRRIIPRRPLIAAAVVLLLLCTAVIYGIFVAPAATVYLDSRENVTVTINSRGNVLSAKGHPALSGRSAEEAVAAITRDMLTTDALNADENTLILGTHKLSDKEREHLHDTVKDLFAESRFHGAIITLSCSDGSGKDAVADLLAKADEKLTPQDLSDLSANDLNILLHEYPLTDGLLLSGTPSESGCIGKDQAIAHAKRQSRLRDGEIIATYSVYRNRLIYLVRITEGDQAEAYFINAADGTLATALKTTPEQLEKEIRTQVRSNSAATPEDIPSAQNNAVIAPIESAEPAEQTETELFPAPATTLPEPQTKQTVPTESPTDRADIPSTAPQPSVIPTEPPTDPPVDDDMKSLILTIPKPSIVNLYDLTLDDFEGKNIAFTPMNSYYWRLNRQNTDFKKSEVIEMGGQDSRIAVYYSEADFNHDTGAHYGYDSGLAEHMTHLIADNGINEDFFRENAVLMLTYYSDTVYPNEEDSIAAIRIKDNIAYVDLLRKNPSRNTEVDFYKSVSAVKLKKTDFKNVDTIFLYVTTQ